MAVLTATTGYPSEKGSTNFSDGPEQTKTQVSDGNVNSLLIANLQRTTIL